MTLGKCFRCLTSTTLINVRRTLSAPSPEIKERNEDGCPCGSRGLRMPTYRIGFLDPNDSHNKGAAIVVENLHVGAQDVLSVRPR